MATGWTALREIGATARTSLIEAAAITWSVSADECETAGDCVQHTPSGRQLSYAELVATAASKPAAQKLRYRPAEKYRYIGTPRARADMGEILTGRATYAMDYQVPGMLYASIERCPSINGSPVEFDSAAALEVSGVVEVFTLNPRDVEPSARCSIVVVAKDTWSALQGRRKLRAQWADAQEVFSDEADFWSAMETQLHSDSANAEHTVGDFDKVNLETLVSSRQTYRTGYQNQTMMEPIAMAAVHRGDSFELWTSTQYPADSRSRIAEITALKQDQIKVNNTIMGGSFGRRYVSDGLTEMIMIADKLRRPVKMVWTREDDIRNGQYRGASMTVVEAYLDPAGEVQRWFQKSVQTSPTEPEKVASLGSGMDDQPYLFPAARYEMTGIRGNVNLGPMRSPPHPAKLFPTVCFIDELAAQLGEDPIDLHIRLIGKPRDIPVNDWLSDKGHADNTASTVQVARTVRELSNWDAPLPDGHGKGFSAGFFFGTHLAMVVETAWREQAISIEKVWCAVNCGRVINPDIARQQVEGGTIYGLSSAMGEVITTKKGAVQQGNFNNYPLMRLAQAPEIFIEFIKSDERPSGLGEPATPPAYPALANSIYASSGKRIREIPLNRHIRFADSRIYS
jgi:isoquinoline 1-oxidoreductase beta subunit